MCNPIIIGAAFSALQAYGQSKGAQQQASYQAQVAEQNARLAEQQAVDAEQRGNLAAQATRRQYAQRFGAQRAAAAASGVDIGTGSALSLLEDTQYFGEVDAATVRTNAAREAWGYRVQGANLGATAGLYRSQASAQNPLFSAAAAGIGSYASGGGFGGRAKNTSLLTSSNAVSDRWYTNPQAGP